MKHTNRIALLILALLMALTCVSCAEEAPAEIPQGFLLAENEEADYYFYYPETWLLDRNEAGLTAAHVSDRDYSNVSILPITPTDNGSEKSYVDPTSGKMDFSKYIEEYYKGQFDSNFKNVKWVNNQDGSLKKDTLTIDGCEAVSFCYSSEIAGEDYSFRAWLISKGGYLYTVLYTAKTELYETNLSEATAIAENIRFK